jgi:hypothetical protein
MRILIRGSSNKGWKLAESAKPKAETELQKLLLESPSLIDLSEIREGTSPLVFAIGEFGLPGSGYSDIVGFTAEGNIAIIECKLAANQEIKRKVIGQILEYAAYLWKLSYEEFDDRVKRLKGKPLAELMWGLLAEDWDEENFRNGITDSLAKGTFILIIVVDEINDELKRIISYLNECSESAFSLHALEVSRFYSGEAEIIVPHLHGLSTKPRTREITQTQREYIEFYQRLAERFGKKLNLSLPQPRGDSYYKIPTGISGVSFEWCFHGRPRNSFGVELHFEKGDKAQSSSMLAEMEKFKQEIEKETGENIVFQKDWGKTWARLYIERNEGNMTPELENWAIEKMVILRRLLQPELDKIGHS